ncbi:diaminopimelate epimerase [Planococcus antarcticus DSM 14505]|uniref:Diaminopimelate epimerase n=1 Tax=Planococcus antarcticus DSM 14505 TaxID=1185653 RepID=A0A1C7DHT7_9BACL|nr:diaminopimelate epimerase [Planococcus antarcticus]ANU10783.1 diaminopimelate epimerase [Planococcus antarcticus DSM 14505]EIM05149.1 diaminopimelate epimerase [Planococcus antarcticus DSM 14505]
MEMTLIKVHGSMNTFYMFESDGRADFAQLAIQLAALDKDIDGILVILPSVIAHAKMRVFNNDGSEASMCGNGLRCVARYVCERDKVKEAVIETMRASLRVKKEETLNEGIETYAVEISPVSFSLSRLPLSYDGNSEWIHKPLSFVSEKIPFSAVAVPNPHLIGIVSADLQKDTSHQQKWAQYFNGNNEYFSDGVNVSYVTPMEGGIFVRTYERGVGFTNACGTAMTASALISCMTGLMPYGDVFVYNPGGMVKCTVRRQGDNIRLQLTGNATYLSINEFEWSVKAADSKILSVERLEEQTRYEEFIEQISSASKQFV